MKQVLKSLSRLLVKDNIVLRANPTRCLTTVKQHKDRLEVRNSNWQKPLCFHNFWLRDHCRCPQCYHVNTNQRIFDLTKLEDLNVTRVKTAEVQDQNLVIQWLDGHTSEYAVDWLEANKFGRSPSRKHELWTKDTVQPEHFNYQSYMSCDITFRKFVSAIISKGFALIDDVPVTVADTKKAVERLAPVMRTFYGEMWEFCDNLEYSDTAYTSEGIGAHTDTTYLLQSAGLQILHCLSHEGTGGDSLLVDGFNCAKQFKLASPEGYKMLTHVPTPGEYIDNQRHYKCNAPVFVHDIDSGEIVQFRHNIYDRAPLKSVATTLIPDYYRHLIQLTKIVRNPENEYWFKLRPGTVLFMDNWRLLHGRSQYTGKRVMTGCYVDRSDYESATRVQKLLQK